MRRIRVMIVDDSAAVRRLLTEALGRHSEIQVVGTAPNGRVALERLARLRPDVLILDVEMPEMDGLQTLVELGGREERPQVIMFSRLTQRGAEATLDALALGACDYVTKPSGRGLAASIEEARHDLVPRILELGPPAADAPAAAPRGPAGAPPRRRRPGLVAAGVVAIGASTGGPNALATILPELPADFPAPILVAQHMPPIFTRHLAERLDARCALRVAEGFDGAPLEPGTVWIAPGDRHMVVVREGASLRVGIHQGSRVHSCRPAADVLFGSVAKSHGAAAVAVLLTGMGHDGAEGCERIRHAGGLVVVQDESTSVVWGMPGRVARAGMADAILPLPEIAPELIAIARRRPDAPPRAA